MYGSRYEKKKAPVALYIILLALFLFAGYILSGLYAVPGASISTLEDSLLYALMHPLSCWNEKTPAFLMIGLAAWIMAAGYFFTYHSRNLQSGMEHGDEDWLDAAAANRELADEDDKYNRILTEHLHVSRRGVLSNNNMLIIGASGSFKTTGLMHQNMLQGYGALVILDVKGDTQRKLGNRMIEMGYVLRSLNFKQPEKSDRYNPFVNIEREDDMLRVIKALHDACRPNKQASAADPFWDDALDLYLKALFEYVWLDARDSGRIGTMNDVVELCSKETQPAEGLDPRDGVTEMQRLIDIKKEKYGPEYPPVRDYYELKGGAPETVGSVILMVNAMLSVCNTGEVKRIFSDNDIDIREVGMGVMGNPENPVVLFLVIPDNNQVYNWIVSMFYTQMFDILIRLSDDELKKPLPVPVEVWMDEFYAGAKPADADVLLGVVRSRNIAMIPILQSVSQIKTLYQNDKWETIMDNVATVAFLGSGPLAHSTHEFISNALGSATAQSVSDNTHFGTNGSSGMDFRDTDIKLMTPGQVKRIPPTECIIFLESRPPVYDTKAIPFDKPEYGFTALPELKKRYSDAFALGEYEHPVYTIYDPIHFHYITVEREKRLQVVEDEKEITAYREAAKKDPRIYEFNIEEKDLLYLSWGRKRSVEEVGQLFQAALSEAEQKAEDIRGLAILQETDGKQLNAEEKHLLGIAGREVSVPVNKSSWSREAPLKELLSDHWEELTQAEREEICIALADGLSEAQVKALLFLPEKEIDVRRRAFKMENTFYG